MYERTTEAEGDPEWDSPEFTEPNTDTHTETLTETLEVPTADVTLTRALPGTLSQTATEGQRNQLATQGVMNMLSMGSPSVPVSAVSLDDDDGSDGGSLMFGADPSVSVSAPAPAPVPEPAPAPLPASVAFSAPVAGLPATSPYGSFGQGQMGGQFGAGANPQQQYGGGYSQMNTQMMSQYGQMNTDGQKPFGQDPTGFGGGMGFGGPMGGSWDMPAAGNGWGNGFSTGAKEPQREPQRQNTGNSNGQSGVRPQQSQQSQGYGQAGQPLWNMGAPAAQSFTSPQQYWMQGGHSGTYSGGHMMEPQYQQPSQSLSAAPLSDARAQPSTGQSPPRNTGGFGNGLKSTDKADTEWTQSGGPPPARPPMPSGTYSGTYSAQQPMGGSMNGSMGGYGQPMGGSMYGFPPSGQPGAYYPGAFSSTGGPAQGPAQGNQWQSWEAQQMPTQQLQRGHGGGQSGGGTEPYRPPARRQGGGVTAGPRGGGY